jgi:hypothetical protein
MTLKETYLKGSVNKHFLPSSYNVAPFFSNTGIRRLSDSFNAAISIDRDSGIAMMYKLLKLESLKCLKEGFIKILKSFLFVLDSNSPEVCLRKVIMQYNDDYTRYYGFERSVTLNYSKLGPFVVLLREQETTVSLSYFLQTNFIGETPRKEMFAYIYLLDFVKSKFNWTEDQLLDKLYTMFKTHGINIAWVYLRNSEVDSKQLILLNLDVISIGDHNKELGSID